MDALLLARWPFAVTVSAHIIFPAFPIGLASYLMVLEALWLKSGRQVYLDLFTFWKKIFATAFGTGVVSGIVMSYQFGTNWSVFSDKTGPVLGPLMGYEVLSAFFTEAGFLGVMLFRMQRVGRGLHMLATTLVAAGTGLSAFWILAANSGMQTPAGHGTNAACQLLVLDWWQVIFNPSFPYRFVHMVLAACLTTAFVAGAVGGWHLLRDRSNEATRTMFSMAMRVATIVAPIQVVAGDFHGLETLEHQPAKIAAMELHFETRKGSPLILFGIPDMAKERTDYAIEIPKLGSLIFTHSLDGTIRGLKDFPMQDRPNALIVFWSFRVMVGLGLAMVAIELWSLILRWRGGLYEARWLHRATVAMRPAGFGAVRAGSITTEAGHQPYTVYGLLRTADSVSAVGAAAVGTSLVAFVTVYFALSGSGTFYILRLMAKPTVPLIASPLTSS